MKNKIFWIVACSLLIVSCESNTYEELGKTPEATSSGPTYVTNIKPIITANCISCHNSTASSQMPQLDSYEDLKSAVINRGLIALIESGGMPKNGPRLPQSSIDLIKTWVANGYVKQ